MNRFCSKEGLYCKLDRTFIFTCHYKEWPHEVVPVRYKVKDEDGCIYCFGNRHNDLEKGSDRTTSVNCCCFDQVIRYITEELSEHINGETFCHKRNNQRCQCIYPAKLRHLNIQRKHDCFHRKYHQCDYQVQNCFFTFEFKFSQCISTHGVYKQIQNKDQCNVKQCVLKYLRKVQSGKYFCIIIQRCLYRQEGCQ